MISYTRQRGYDLLPALGSASFDITCETEGYDLLPALGSASCETARQGGTTCYRHWDLRVVILCTRQGTCADTGIGNYDL